MLAQRCLIRRRLPVRVVSDPNLSRGEVAAVYAVSLGVTLVPLALALLALPSRS